MTIMTEQTPPLALVLGARGGIGGHIMTMLMHRGWRVRALVRGNLPQASNPPQEWVEGDALNADDVLKAASGASLIVHAVNPPGYKDWDRLVIPMLDNTISAAGRVGARIVFPGTVYNFGPDVFPDPTEQSPQNPITRKGAIRKAMELRLRDASQRGIPVLIVRAGDYYGPKARNNWFSQGLVKPGTKVASVSNPGASGIGHQWAYLPDVAETFGKLLDRAGELEDFAVYHMEGHWDADGRAFAGAIERGLQRPIPMTPVPWWIFRVASPFVPMFREILEMRYLWKMPLRMNNGKLVAFLGSEPHTPIDDAVRATLADLKCV